VLKARVSLPTLACHRPSRIAEPRVEASWPKGEPRQDLRRQQRNVWQAVQSTFTRSPRPRASMSADGGFSIARLVRRT
jgi:hypothetical protein